MFVEFTGLNGKKMIFREDAITAVTQEQSAVLVYTGQSGFHVRESYDEVSDRVLGMKKIKPLGLNRQDLNSNGGLIEG